MNISLRPTYFRPTNFEIHDKIRTDIPRNVYDSVTSSMSLQSTTTCTIFSITFYLTSRRYANWTTVDFSNKIKCNIITPTDLKTKINEFETARTIGKHASWKLQQNVFFVVDLILDNIMLDFLIPKTCCITFIYIFYMYTFLCRKGIVCWNWENSGKKCRN